MAEVYPDLVVYDQEGNVEVVQYYKVNAMLLNEKLLLAKEALAQK